MLSATAVAQAYEFAFIVIICDVYCIVFATGYTMH